MLAHIGADGTTTERKTPVTRKANETFLKISEGDAFLKFLIH